MTELFVKREGRCKARLTIICTCTPQGVVYQVENAGSSEHASHVSCVVLYEWLACPQRCSFLYQRLKGGQRQDRTLDSFIQSLSFPKFPLTFKINFESIKVLTCSLFFFILNESGCSLHSPEKEQKV
jgi:hypothetical protein